MRASWNSLVILGHALFVVGHSSWNGQEIPTGKLFVEIAGTSMLLEEQFWYTAKSARIGVTSGGGGFHGLDVGRTGWTRSWPSSLTAQEIADVVEFVRDGLLDARARPDKLCKLVTSSLPSGRAVAVFEGCD